MWSLKINKIKTLNSLIILFLILPSFVKAQEFNLSNAESSLKVFGTSSLHDWHIEAETKSGKVGFSNLETGELSTCDFTVVSESLKSGKKAMDKNTYKALKTDGYKSISFKLAEVKEIVDKGSGTFLLKCSGNLTITDSKKLIPIEFSMEVKEGKIILSGEKTIKMTDFNIEPPTALFGTITTGDEITIKFNTIYK